MNKGIIEKTQRISSKMTTFIWFFGVISSKLTSIMKQRKYYFKHSNLSDCLTYTYPDMTPFKIYEKMLLGLNIKNTILRSL